jgi:hypothetical protein
MTGWSRTHDDRVFGRGDIVLSLLVVLGLALPFLPLPGDMGTRMEVRFRAPGMEAPRSFGVNTTMSACAVLARSLEYDDPATGHFTRIACD